MDPDSVVAHDVDPANMDPANMDTYQRFGLKYTMSCLPIGYTNSIETEIRVKTKCPVSGNL